jgi:molecular chaperone GrpE
VTDASGDAEKGVTEDNGKADVTEAETKDAAGADPAVDPADAPERESEQGEAEEPSEQKKETPDELAVVRTQLEERTRDLQRITAEYANYRKRVERDKALVVEQASGNVLAALLPVLDDLDRAREHGDLTGPFAAVADQLVAAVGKFGLTPFGDEGDAFDPTRHEAVAHSTSADVTEPTCVTVMRRGYLLGERLLRPALVGVADPE